MADLPCCSAASHTLIGSTEGSAVPVQKRIQATVASVAGLVLAVGAVAYGLQGSSTWPMTAVIGAVAAFPTTSSSAPTNAPSGTSSGTPPTAPDPSAAPPSTSPSAPAASGDPVFAAPIASSACMQQLRRLCYSPAQYRVAYDLNPLYARGITGKGRTIVLIESFGSPTLQHDLDVYDKQWGLPDVRLQTEKWGAVPAFDPLNGDMRGWAFESTMDVEAAHAVAPGADIVVIETAIAETEGTVGVPEMMDALKRDVDA